MWTLTKDGDPRLLALHARHYSRRPGERRQRQCLPPGQKLALVTEDGRAAFAWVRNTVERYDKQAGVSCTFFRNEGPLRSSDLIREAMALAWARWPGERLFTYVDPKKVRSTNPGYCYLVAGWRRCGRSKRGLILLEVLP